LRYCFLYIEIDREKEKNSFVGGLKIDLENDAINFEWDQCTS